MELYKNYLKEILDRDCIYDDDCFVIYQRYEEEVSIIDYYCVPEKRSKGIMKNLIDGLFDNFKKEGIKRIYGFTDTRTTTWKRSEELLLKYGFSYIGKSPDDDCYNNYVLTLGENNDG